jgi:hypothetical protein
VLGSQLAEVLRDGDIDGLGRDGVLAQVRIRVYVAQPTASATSGRRSAAQCTTTGS